MTERYFTTHEISKLCNVYPTTVIKWIDEGILPAFTTPGGHRRVKREDLLLLMKKNNMPMTGELLRDSKDRVLVIDDDPKITRMIKTILEAERDLEVVTAKSGFEAGFIVSEFNPDIILLDFLMPEVDGFEVCSRLRQDPKTKGIPVIAVTILKDQKEIQKMYTCGITDYLAKPFKSDELLEKVKKYIKK